MSIERVAQDREGRFSTSVFERYQLSEKALVAAMAEMYFQRVSTRKVKAVTEELCGHSMLPGTVSNLVKKLDASLEDRRQVLGVELANRASRSIWREFLLALEEVLSEAVW